MNKRGLAFKEPLTPREMEVFSLLVNTALTNPEIGDKLEISIRGVAYLVSRVYEKLGIKTGLGKNQGRYILMDNFRSKARISWTVQLMENRKANLIVRRKSVG